MVEIVDGRNDGIGCLKCGYILLGICSLGFKGEDRWWRVLEVGRVFWIRYGKK